MKHLHDRLLSLNRRDKDKEPWHFSPWGWRFPLGPACVNPNTKRHQLLHKANAKPPGHPYRWAYLLYDKVNMTYEHTTQTLVWPRDYLPEE